MERKNRTVLFATLIVVLLVIIIYLLILDFGKIRNHDLLTPTGNVDIFDIDCNCTDKENDCTSPSDVPAFQEQDVQGNVNENKFDENSLIVSDNYTAWGEEKLRIFSNPTYEYTSKIAPGSQNSYMFVVRNNNDFDIVVDFSMIEKNTYGVNMKYKLKSRGKFLVGSDTTYEDVSKLQLTGITIGAHESVPYLLDWKWIDSANDTEIGESIAANYQLTIHIGANQK